MSSMKCTLCVEGKVCLAMCIFSIGKKLDDTSQATTRMVIEMTVGYKGNLIVELCMSTVLLFSKFKVMEVKANDLLSIVTSVGFRFGESIGT